MISGWVRAFGFWFFFCRIYLSCLRFSYQEEDLNACYCVGHRYKSLKCVFLPLLLFVTSVNRSTSNCCMSVRITYLSYKVSSLTELHLFNWWWLVLLHWGCHLELQQYGESMAWGIVQLEITNACVLLSSWYA
jgi:hypothetical protein